MNNTYDEGRAALTAYTPYVTEDGQIGMRKAKPDDWAVYLKADVTALQAYAHALRAACADQPWQPTRVRALLTTFRGVAKACADDGTNCVHVITVCRMLDEIGRLLPAPPSPAKETP